LATSLLYTLSLHDALPISSLNSLGYQVTQTQTAVAQIFFNAFLQDRTGFVEAHIQTGDVIQVTAQQVRHCFPRNLIQHFTELQRSEEHTSELQSRENLVCR